MKKFLSILLCLMLCASAAALAESAGVQTVNSVSGLFSYDLPIGYIVLTSESAQSIIESNADLVAEAGIDPAMLEALDYQNSDYAYTADFSGNLNVQITAGSGLSQATLEAAAPMLAEQLTSTYVQQLGLAEEDCAYLGVEQIGSNLFFIYHANIMGVSCNQYFTCNDAQDMFVITCTNMDESEERAILETFELINE